MPETDGLKLTYNAAEMRARLEATCADFRRLPSLPDDLKLRVEKKLEAERLKGHIVDAVTSYKMIERFITLLKSEPYQFIPANHTFTLTLALGIPAAISSMHVEVSPDGAATLSLDLEQKDILKLRYQTFAVCVRHLLRGSALRPDQGQIASLYARAIKGEILNAVRLLPAPPLRQGEGQEGAAYSFIFNDNLQLFVLRVHHMGSLLTPAARQELGNLCRVESEKYVGLHFQGAALDERLAAAASGIESVDLVLPLDILIAFKSPPQQPAGALAAPNWPLSRSASPLQQGPPPPSVLRPIAAKNALLRTLAPAPAPAPAQASAQTPLLTENLLHVEVSKDRMHAHIVKFKTSFYSVANLDEAWLKRGLERWRIKSLSSEHLARAVELLKQKGDLSGMEIGLGVHARPGSEPYIARALPDASLARNEQMNHRKTRQAGMVKAGELVATMAFTIQEEVGHDVYGTSVLAAAPSSAGLTIGEGIELREGRNFYALHDGMLQMESHSIAVSPSFVHTGDVNLASGDIDFDGPVLIQGSVDTGASVRCSGDLTIEGSVRGGHIYCGGNLRVMSGINTSARGFIFCRGNLVTDFIENSVITCLGNLEAAKAILRSKLFIEGDLKVSQQSSVLAGGEIYLWGVLTANQVGLPSGVATNIYLGCNWRWARSFESCGKRLDCFKGLVTKVQKELGELKKKPQNKLSGNKKDALAEYQSKIERLNALVARCNETMQRLKRDKPFKQASKAMVHGRVEASCSFWADHKLIKIPDNVQGVAILASSPDGEGAVKVL